jgi:hypothetical protein
VKGRRGLNAKEGTRGANMDQNERHLVLDVAEPAIADEGERVPYLIQAAEPQKATFRTSWVKVDVECKKCSRKFEIDFFPFAPHPILVRAGTAGLKPYLREILTEEFGAFPDLIPCEPPTSVSSCSACARTRIPREGDTFKKRTHRGKFKTIGRKRGKGSPVPELDPDSTYDTVDHQLTIAHRDSRYGKGIDDANKQSAIREWLFEREQLAHATKVLEGLTLREIEKQWGIPRMTASRGKEEIQLLANAGNA